MHMLWPYYICCKTVPCKRGGFLIAKQCTNPGCFCKIFLEIVFKNLGVFFQVLPDVKSCSQKSCNTVVQQGKHHFCQNYWQWFMYHNLGQHLMLASKYWFKQIVEQWQQHRWWWWWIAAELLWDLSRKHRNQCLNMWQCKVVKGTRTM